MILQNPCSEIINGVSYCGELCEAAFGLGLKWEQFASDRTKFGMNQARPGGRTLIKNRIDKPAVMHFFVSVVVGVSDAPASPLFCPRPHPLNGGNGECARDARKEV